MNPIFYFVLIVAVIFGNVAPQAADGIKLMTYNIRNSQANDGVNDWTERKERVAKLVVATQADVIGLQESLNDQVKFMDLQLAMYGRVGVGRNNGKDKGEFSPIYYNKHRFTLGEYGTFWLSETPEVAGSKSWDAAITRICTYAQLTDKSTKSVIWVFNTHFDHKGQIARLESARLIVSKAQEMAKDAPFVMMGDFNFHPESEPYSVISSKMHDAFSCYSDGPQTTGNGFAVNGNAGNRIDHIFYSDQLKCTDYWIDDENDGKHYPSDHLPVISTLSFIER